MQLSSQSRYWIAILKSLLKQAAIRGGLEAISRLRLDRLFPDAAGRGLIFTLHHVRPRQPAAFQPNSHLEITPNYLADVIEEALAAGLTPLALSDLPDRLADPNDTNRYMCFTLDDGYRNNAEYAAPVFRRYNVPYTIFVTPGFVDRTATLWWETAAALLARVEQLDFDFGSGMERLASRSIGQKTTALRKICEAINHGDQDAAIMRLDEAARAAGVDPLGIVDRELMTETELRDLVSDPLAGFGGHTMTHPVLSRVSAERLAEEIKRSLRIVSGYACRPVDLFAYPYGTRCAAGPREFAAAAAAGVRIGVTTRPGMIQQDAMQAPTALTRVSLNGLYQRRHYVRALVSGVPFKLKG